MTSPQKRINLRGGGYVALTDGDEEVLLEVGWEGGSTAVYLAPDELHELAIVVCTDPHTGQVMKP